MCVWKERIHRFFPNALCSNENIFLGLEQKKHHHKLEYAIRFAWQIRRDLRYFPSSFRTTSLRSGPAFHPRTGYGFFFCSPPVCPDRVEQLECEAVRLTPCYLLYAFVERCLGIETPLVQEQNVGY